MNSKELLLSKRWILKRDNREQYYKMKDEAKSLKKLFQDTLGYALISHQNFIKLDKIPGKAEPWMGISEFQSLQEYQMFCYILIFLEDQDAEDQFILSHLTEFIQLQLKVGEDYWLKYVHRKMFVNVLKFCLKEQLFIQDDGNADSFIQSENVEVLFENTGLSRYFMRSFVADIFEYKTPQDFMREEWVGLEQDRGIVRKQRIYRRLMLSCGIYKDNNENDDFAYIHNYRKRIQNDFQKICPCDLQVYHSSAYLIFDDEVRIGKRFPKTNAMDEMIILIMTYLRKQVKKSKIKKDDCEIICIDKERFLTIIKRLIEQNEKYLPVTYRQKNRSVFISDLYQYMIQLGFAQEKDENIIFYPIIAKLTGYYEEE